MRCREVMSKKVVVCQEGDTVADCARLMRTHNTGSSPSWTAATW